MPDLLRMGVTADESRYLGMHSYVADSPTANRQWAERFYERTGFRRLLGWYLTHPVRTFSIVRSEMLWEEELMRANNIGNYAIEEGHPPYARTRRFAWWRWGMAGERADGLTRGDVPQFHCLVVGGRNDRPGRKRRAAPGGGWR